MQALLAVRATAADGRPYDEDSRLADAGFTSMEMVKVMLAVEAAFDIMIPPQDITPANFATPAAIAAMVRKLVPGA
jgi:acyl carrier protein